MSGERIVVGIDARPESCDALAWAAAEAATRGAELVVVHAWERTCAQAPYAAGHRREEEVRRHARDRAAMAAAIDRVESRHPELRIQRELIVGNAVKELLRHTADATLLVLGSAARHGHDHLGPVLLACLRHARCPVAVVHAGDAPPATRDRPLAAVVDLPRH
ncbi:hypothetical protein Sru01_16950 [Sphaerisporangium rufum]|uniref:UspA domain-containing protein n=1 Tax=Sphaerisporangium rufum TaxID=1381558 RepID=A0A919QZN2_9ACTN|nr:universal stress protein [Sphaerisporangium rufum]GII76713.1 hypothetical protein Sru01_16950 [Sphaerisporangium rufum]